VLTRRTAQYVGCQIAFGTFEEFKLYRFAFVQGSVSIFLDCGKMDENVLSGRTLDKTVTLGAIKPLYCSLLSHKLTPFASMSEILPCRKSGREKRLLLCREFAQQKKVHWDASALAAAPAAPVFREAPRSNQNINPNAHPDMHFWAARNDIQELWIL
jgi:hypothetical protein